MNDLPIYDIYQASFLALYGIQPKLQSNGSRVLFVFPLSKKLSKLIDAYSGNPAVNVLDYAQALRRLRAAMLDARDRGGVQR